jgi:hypothetical protein
MSQMPVLHCNEISQQSAVPGHELPPHLNSGAAGVLPKAAAPVTELETHGVRLLFLLQLGQQDLLDVSGYVDPPDNFRPKVDRWRDKQIV